MQREFSVLAKGRHIFGRETGNRARKVSGTQGTSQVAWVTNQSGHKPVAGDRGMGGVRETGEERAGSVISTMTGSGREIQKGKVSLFVTAYIQSKKRTQQRFLTSI